MSGLGTKLQLPSPRHGLCSAPSLQLTSQTALCRCGMSTIKPWCDGSHAQIGWEDAKSDQRVPDRLARYTGLGAKVADNRGTCAHSGFCTDRVPSVFRTDAPGLFAHWRVVRSYA